MKPGATQLTVMWRGKPIWVIRRTPEMIAALDDESRLRDPHSLHSHQPAIANNTLRSINPEYAVLIGLCTHLGCIPRMVTATKVSHSLGSASFYCPCHGSRFDLAGRVYRESPASSNLEVPPYHFMEAHTLVIGEEA
jgi:ubiquinol-cytochrome c reductase iron-sulfur subunit